MTVCAFFQRSLMVEYVENVCSSQPSLASSLIAFSIAPVFSLKYISETL